MIVLFEDITHAIGIKVKLSLSYVWSYEIFKRFRTVSYDLKLPIQLSPVRSTFHVLMLKKCIGDPVSILPL